MASIVKKGRRFYVSYTFKDVSSGESKQEWEGYDTREAAEARKIEIEKTLKNTSGYLKVDGGNIKTVDDMLEKYVEFRAKKKWAVSTYAARMSLIRHYISPNIGKCKLSELTPMIIDVYYQKLAKTPAVETNHPNKNEYVSSRTIIEINKILNSCFKLAVRWNLMEKNPCEYVELEKAKEQKREIWTEAELICALEAVKNDPKYELLHLAINLAFACSMRKGEIMGLQWSNVDVSDKAIRDGRANLYIDKELLRVNAEALDIMDAKDVIRIFPPMKSRGSHKTRLVLKKPKTDSSIRKVFIPATVAHYLQERKRVVDDYKELFGSEFNDYGLVFCSPIGNPIDGHLISSDFKKFCKEYDLPDVVFHSLRHLSLTEKLALTADIKSVQGDSGHAQATMVTERYAHIMDEKRRFTAEKMEKAFYSGNAADTTKQHSEGSLMDSLAQIFPPEIVERFASDPEQLKNLLTSALAFLPASK